MKQETKSRKLDAMMRKLKLESAKSNKRKEKLEKQKRRHSRG